jgi:hypothetical protein
MKKCITQIQECLSLRTCDNNLYQVPPVFVLPTIMYIGFHLLVLQFLLLKTSLRFLDGTIFWPILTNLAVELRIIGPFPLNKGRVNTKITT